ncbi:MAG TPA: TrbG/VirB9 family P-type conjugative transfer protein [Allosphingosinicella sp.]|nr:TrbG/VirB9 family P-type conjugative transfer protein [Allosphingosinicella sp.]
MRILLLAFALAGAPASAQIRPEPGQGDPRIQSIEYDSDQVVQIQAAPGYQVTLELGSDEQIENVAVGDSGAWQVTANRAGSRLFVKPIQAGVTTNMTVVTNVRTYAFELVPLFGASAEMAFTIRFRYPAPATALASAEAELIVEGRYRLSGERTLRPSRISDDGRHTYIEFPRDQAIPAIYAVDDRGQESLVNGMMRDDLFVIDSVVPRIVFRIDQHVARATRLAPQAAR